MPIKLFNTLTRRKETFKSLKDKRVGFYACGPTVYWFAHVGNFRTYVFEDILRRVLEYNGYKVKHVMNFTDVGHLTSDQDTGEDKIEQRAAKEGKTAKEITDFYIKAFKRDAELLNIKKPTIYAKATEHIKDQIELVKILEKKGYAYKIYDGIYFDTRKLKDYGKLTHLDEKGLKAGARVEMVEGKKNPTDFALWKLTPAGVRRQQEWNSPWGKGFPGWHLECSAMSQKYLGKQFDIHGGAIDLIPVHHTNEIAQSQAAYGKNPAKYWIHGEFMLIEGQKMSKSLGSFITIEQIAKKFSPLAFRYLVLTAHYRSQINLTWESLESAQNALNNLYLFVWDAFKTGGCGLRLARIADSMRLANKETKNALKAAVKYRENFLAAVNDDLDTPQAIGLVWEMINDVRITAAIKKDLLLDFDQVLGLRLDRVRLIPPSAKIKKMAQTREKYRKEKQWLKADTMRAEIEEAGWILEDTAQGPKLKPKKIEIR